MPFTIPNEADAGAAEQAEPDSVDFDILAFGLARTAVISGCAVTAQGVPDMTVAVASGSVQIAGEYVAVTAGNGTITAADATNPRFDLVTINTSGAIVVTAGTPAASPVFPAHPANVVVLAAVFVAANDTAIGSTEIVDKRMLQHGGSNFVRRAGQSQWHCVPAGQLSYSGTVGKLSSNASNSDGFTIAVPWPVDNTINIEGYGTRVITASDAAAPNIKFAIYHDAGGFPGALVTGSVSSAVGVGTTGVKSTTITPVTLEPGLYWMSFLGYDFDDGTINPVFDGFANSVTVTAAGGPSIPTSNSTYFKSLYHSQANGTSTFPDPWTSAAITGSSNAQSIRWWVQVA